MTVELDPRAVRVSEKMRREFADTGFLVIPDVIDPQRLAGARAIVTEAIDQGSEGGPRAVTHNAELSDDSSRRLIAFYTENGVHDLANQLLRPDNPAPPPTFVQAALTFPPVGMVPRPHVDGLYVQRPDGTCFVGPDTFSLLGGIIVSDQSGQRGGLTIWPGSHLVLSDHIRRRGIDIMRDEEHFRNHNTYPAGVSLADPMQISASAGSVVFCHYLLAHCPGSHFADDGEVRKTLYYRLWADGHDQRSVETLFEPMCEFA